VHQSFHPGYAGRSPFSGVGGWLAGLAKRRRRGSSWVDDEDQWWSDDGKQCQGGNGTERFSDQHR
jgi:hypothetical protein